MKGKRTMVSGFLNWPALFYWDSVGREVQTRGPFVVVMLSYIMLSGVVCKVGPFSLKKIFVASSVFVKRLKK